MNLSRAEQRRAWPKGPEYGPRAQSMALGSTAWPKSLGSRAEHYYIYIYMYICIYWLINRYYKIQTKSRYNSEIRS